MPALAVPSLGSALDPFGDSGMLDRNQRQGDPTSAVHKVFMEPLICPGLAGLRQVETDALIA
jgi:hypothetical protein